MNDTDLEGLRDQLRNGEDDLNETERAAAKRQGVIFDGDEDVHLLHRLVNGIKLADDQDVKRLRQIIGDERRRRLHSALDRMIDAVYQRRCAGDRAFLRRAGIRHDE